MRNKMYVTLLEGAGKNQVRAIIFALVSMVIIETDLYMKQSIWTNQKAVD